MVTEEINLNTALEALGCEVIETDLGEYILQVADREPLRILWRQPCIKIRSKFEMF